MRVKSMMRASVALAALSAAAFGATGTAVAQEQPIPPERYTLDPRGVDLVTGGHVMSVTEVTIGDPAQGGLSHGRVLLNGFGRDLLSGSITLVGGDMLVSVGSTTEVFVPAGGGWASKSKNGSTLSWAGSTGTFTDRLGNVATFNADLADRANNYAATEGLITSYVAVDGRRMDYHWKTGDGCVPLPFPDTPCAPNHLVRLAAITSNSGYMLKYTFTSNNPDDGYLWAETKSVTGLNLAVEYCDPLANTCTFSNDWPSATYVTTIKPFPAFGSVLTVTDQSGRETAYDWTPAAFTVTRPGSTSPDLVVETNPYPDLKVGSVTDASGEWTYSYSTSGDIFTASAAGPLGQALEVDTDLTVGRATAVRDADGNAWAYEYDVDMRLARITNPEGDAAAFEYDARGNLIETTRVAKPGSPLADIVTSSEYPDACSDPGVTRATCNKPISATDARGGVTNYDWDGDTGQLLSVTQPAPTTGADRPQARFAYADFQARYRNSASTYVTGSAVSLPVEASACATGGAACDGTAAEVLTTVAYPSSLVPNNLQPVTISRGSGVDPSMSVVAMTYTANGDVESVDGPLSGSVDTVRYRYDDARQVVGMVGPDPDGAGPLKNRAQRVSRNVRGQVTVTETGTVPGYSDGDWANFDAILKSETDYDSTAFFRAVQTRQMSDVGVVSSVQQISYDAAGRVNCSATRMNPDTYGSLPTSACTPTTAGRFGPDRIAQMTYDDLGRPVSTTAGLGTPEASTESVTYTANGQTASLTDGRGNVSLLEYDGFDRMVKLRYPNAVGGGTSTTDYEQYGYNAAGQADSIRNRDGDTTTLEWDALGRVVEIDAPAGTMDVSSSYDNLGRRTSTTGGSLTVATVYDALSRPVSQSTTGLGAMTYGYDAGGRLSRLEWPDGFAATYAYDVYGAITGISQIPAGGSASSLATYAYDDLGLPTGVSRANGVATTYGYDAFARMTSLAHDPAGTSDDLTLAFAYNPAGQIVGRSVSDDDYVYTPSVAATNYGRDGLNRMTSIGGVAVAYDDNGNATSIAGNTYGYDAANRLVSASAGAGAATFGFDPMDRLSSKTVGGVSARFQYAGDQMVAEYDAAGAITRRHVPGAGPDGVAVTYDGSGVSNRSWALADERGSVVAQSSGAGSVSNINRYDEYGVPAAGNTGRFQYTGQPWLAEAGAYHYRARTYLPQTGRFLQPDPVGYAEGSNLYAYVGGDPINAIDPSGLGQIDLPVEWFCSWSGTKENPYQTFMGCRETAWETFYWDDGDGLWWPAGGPAGGPSGGNQLSETCLSALAAADKNPQAVARALSSFSAMYSAQQATGVDWRILAAIGIRETGFQNIREIGGGQGRGVYQIDLGAHPGITESQAFDIDWSANWAANYLSSNLSIIRNDHNFTPPQLLQAMAASWNLGPYDFSGDPSKIDVGSAGNNYGSNVVGLIHCFL